VHILLIGVSQIRQWTLELMLSDSVPDSYLGPRNSDCNALSNKDFGFLFFKETPSQCPWSLFSLFVYISGLTSEAPCTIYIIIFFHSNSDITCSEWWLIGVGALRMSADWVLIHHFRLYGAQVRRADDALGCETSCHAKLFHLFLSRSSTSGLEILSNYLAILSLVATQSKDEKTP
jgi:hypothetical protein